MYDATLTKSYPGLAAVDSAIHHSTVVVLGLGNSLICLFPFLYMIVNELIVHDDNVQPLTPADTEDDNFLF